jgi:hypothetical protein
MGDSLKNIDFAGALATVSTNRCLTVLQFTLFYVTVFLFLA